MQFGNLYSLNSCAPIEGGYACMSINDIFATEYVAAAQAGTGPGTPDNVTGALTAGTIAPGMVVMLDGNATWIPATSPVVTGSPPTNFPVPIYFVHEGDIDLTGRFVGRLTSLRGSARLSTPSYNTADAYPINTPLIAVAGVFTPKTFGDGLQVVGYVGPNGVANGVLDVIFEATPWG